MGQRKVKIVWTEKRYQFFCEAGKLNEFQRKVLQGRIHCLTVKEQAIYHDCSDSTINRTIHDIMLIYDEVQKEYPDILAPRWESDEEKYMDNN